MLTHEEMRRRIETESRSLEIQYPMQVKQMTNEETKAKNRKIIEALSKPKNELMFWVDGSVTLNGQTIVEPIESNLTDEEKQWVDRKMRGSPRSWQRWFTGIYFTEEQKRELGL